MKSSAAVRLSPRSPPPMEERLLPPLPAEVVESGLRDERGEGAWSIAAGAEARAARRVAQRLWGGAACRGAQAKALPTLRRVRRVPCFGLRATARRKPSTVLSCERRYRQLSQLSALRARTRRHPAMC